MADSPANLAAFLESFKQRLAARPVANIARFANNVTRNVNRIRENTATRLQAVRRGTLGRRAAATERRVRNAAAAEEERRLRNAAAAAAAEEERRLRNAAANGLLLSDIFGNPNFNSVNVAAGGEQTPDEWRQAIAARQAAAAADEERRISNAAAAAAAAAEEERRIRNAAVAAQRRRNEEEAAAAAAATKGAAGGAPISGHVPNGLGAASRQLPIFPSDRDFRSIDRAVQEIYAYCRQTSRANKFSNDFEILQYRDPIGITIEEKSAPLINPHNWRPIDTIGDGTCFIHAILLSVSPTYRKINPYEQYNNGNEKSAMEMRAIIGIIFRQLFIAPYFQGTEFFEEINNYSFYLEDTHIMQILDKLKLSVVMVSSDGSIQLLNKNLLVANVRTRTDDPWIFMHNTRKRSGDHYSAIIVDDVDKKQVFERDVCAQRSNNNINKRTSGNNAFVGQTPAKKRELLCSKQIEIWAEPLIQLLNAADTEKPQLPTAGGFFKYDSRLGPKMMLDPGVFRASYGSIIPANAFNNSGTGSSAGGASAAAGGSGGGADWLRRLMKRTKAPTQITNEEIEALLASTSNLSATAGGASAAAAKPTRVGFLFPKSAATGTSAAAGGASAAAGRMDESPGAASEFGVLSAGTAAAVAQSSVSTCENRVFPTKPIMPNENAPLERIIKYSNDYIIYNLKVACILSDIVHAIIGDQPENPCNGAYRLQTSIYNENIYKNAVVDTRTDRRGKSVNVTLETYLKRLPYVSSIVTNISERDALNAPIHILDGIYTLSDVSEYQFDSEYDNKLLINLRNTYYYLEKLNDYFKAYRREKHPPFQYLRWKDPGGKAHDIILLIHNHIRDAFTGLYIKQTTQKNKFYIDRLKEIDNPEKGDSKEVKKNKNISITKAYNRLYRLYIDLDKETIIQNFIKDEKGKIKAALDANYERANKAWNDIPRTGTTFGFGGTRLNSEGNQIPQPVKMEGGAKTRRRKSRHSTTSRKGRRK
jgi:hypothetical protein